MVKYDGEEKRKHGRLQANFVISYRRKELPDNYDLSQTKNVSQGGLMLTTNRKFDKGTFLSITIRFPFVPQRIEVTGEVVESKKVVTNFIYETRIRFLDSDTHFFKDLGEFINKRLAKND